VLDLMLEKVFKRGYSIKQVGLSFSNLKKKEKTYEQLTLDSKVEKNNHELLELINDIEEHTDSKILIGRELKK